MDFNLQSHTILLAIAGSRAYGTHTSTSDVDVKGVAIPPAPFYFGHQSFEQADSPLEIAAFESLVPPENRGESKLEGSVYELNKFARLAADSNPNILDLLFCRDEEVLLRNGLGSELRESRDLFISARAKHTFSGYAMAQLKRIRSHRSWLLNPPKAQPTRAGFSLPERTLIPADQLAAINAAVQKKLDEWSPNFNAMAMSDRVSIQEGLSTFLNEFCANLPKGMVSEDDRVAGATWLAAARMIGASDNLILLLQQEREYAAAIQHWRQYQGWRQSRNAARAELEAKHGFDCKHGAHLVRLMRLGMEILTTGKIHVWRGGIDAEELLSIRNGAWSYDQVVEYAEKMDADLGRIYAQKTYVVPHTPDRNAIETLCMSLIQRSLSHAK